jgi:DNA-binding IclR family transcriptional regulator
LTFRSLDNLVRCTIASIDLGLNGTERDILRLFRAYGVTAHQMLFFPAAFAKSESRKFTNSIQSMIECGLVVKERRHEAYSLTPRGYRESLKVAQSETADCSH